ncbi:MAG: hypothetical protein QGG40_16695, partial [Myxococcota bacterium]|nr:hypothetical protein [Myxococcota bacterium]
ARAGRFGENCALHALQRWLRAGTHEAEVERLGQVQVFPEPLGQFLGTASACLGLGSCDPTATWSTSCLVALDEISGNPEICAEFDRNQSRPR